MNRERIVIIGASLAGATAAATLREEGFDGAIDLIGAEAQPPYNRPPLSKEYLRGQARFEEQLVKPVDYYAEQRITLRLGVRASAVDSKRKLVELEGGEQIAYDRLLVATGGRNRPLAGPGAALEGLFQLRTVEDCDRLLEMINTMLYISQTEAAAEKPPRSTTRTKTSISPDRLMSIRAIVISIHK